MMDDRRKRPIFDWRWIVYILAVLLFNIPVLATILTAFKTTADINASPPVWFFTPTVSHFIEVFTDPKLRFESFMWNSVVISLGGAFLAIALTLPAAYAIARFNVGARFILPYITNLRAVPLIIFVIPLYLMYQVTGLLDTRLGLALIGCIINLPLALIMFVGFFQDVPVDLDEAAKVDGANTFQILWHIIIPLARPIITATAILSFIYTWNEFLFGLILTTKEAVPVTVGATFFVTSYGIKWGTTAAAMVLSILPPMALGVFSYRWMSKAVMGGAIKG